MAYEVSEAERAENKHLVEEYPFLLPHNRWTDAVDEDYNYEYTELDDMPDGWRNAFGLQMCEELKQALLEEGGEKLLSEYRINQIKEKFGGLRFYTNWTTPKTNKIIDKYENISYSTCICCGAPAKWITKGWISPFCDKCKPDENCVEIEKFYAENI